MAEQYRASDHAITTTGGSLHYLSSIPYGYCQCGCGKKTNICKHNNDVIKKGEPRKYIRGHQNNKLLNVNRQALVKAYEAGHSTVTIARYCSKQLGRSITPRNVMSLLNQEGCAIRSMREAARLRWKKDE